MKRDGISLVFEAGVLNGLGSGEEEEKRSSSSSTAIS